MFIAGLHSKTIAAFKSLLDKRKDDPEVFRKVVLINLVCIIGILVLIPMGFLAFWQSNYYLGCFDFLVALLLIFTLIYLNRNGSTENAGYMGITGASLLFWFLVFTGGVNNSAYVWIYTFPLFAMFLLGSRKGLIANILFFVPIVLFLVIEPQSSVFTTYSTDLKMRIIPSFLVVLVYAYLFEFMRESSYFRLQCEVKEHRKTANKLHVAKTVSENANRAKSDFLANMSHELRTPLNHIIGFTELVVDKHYGNLNDVQSEYLQDVLSSSRHLLSLVNDILDLSKIEAGKLELEREEVAIEPLLDNSLTMVKQKALKHRLKLDLEIDGLPPKAKLDERKLKQILFNLLSNAVKFTPDGGHIELRGKLSSISNNGVTHPGVEFSVVDSGIGLTFEELSTIFKPFERGDTEKNRNYEGTGLGLSLTKRLVELHGGKIWAESKGKNQGSVFSFVIPL